MIPVFENRPGNIYCRDTLHTGKSMKYNIPHIHYHLEVAFIIAGHVRAQVDSEIYDANAGDIIIVFPNQVHSYEPIERDQHILAIVNPDWFPEFEKQFKDSVPVSNLIKGNADNGELVEILKKLNDEYLEDNSYSEAVMRGYLLTFFGKLFRKTEWKHERPEDYCVLGRIMNYCTTNFDKDLSLDVLEKELYLSKSYISRIINNKLNMGFNDYVNSIRISNACRLLSHTNKSMTEISELVGFNTLRTFNRAFIKQKNVTPSEYQKTHFKVDIQS